jgi:pimeloyl-ACP methyl ester carboxylesterase
MEATQPITTRPVSIRRGPADMHVSELGEGPRVVFVHGGGEGGLSAWRAQVPLADRFRLVVPFRPGYGESPSDGTEDFEAHAIPVADLLGEGAHVVAQSYGALVAMFAAARRPSAVRSLTLVESGSSAIARGRPAVDDYERRMSALASSPPDDLDAYVRAIFAILDPRATLPTPLPAGFLRWAERLPGFRWPWQGDVPVAALRDAGFPILAVSGGQRPMYEEISDALSEKLGAERAIVPGPHALQTVGAPFNALLEHFLTRAEARRS